MKTIGAYEAKTNLARLLERVSKGEKIVITKHGVPVAIISPFPEEEEPTDVQESITRIRTLRKRLSLNGLSLKELIEEGRK